MKVYELINFLKTQPQDLDVVYRFCSENVMLTDGQVAVKNLGLARSDGWIPNARPDKPTQQYLVFPGN